MKKSVSENEDLEKEALPEYDFTGGVRGKHHKAYREGHRVRIRKSDGRVIEHHFTLAEGAVMLEPDVRDYFPDSKAVNDALRSLIKLAPKKRRARAKAKQP